MVKEIPLTQGKTALVDDEDFERLMKLTWYFRRGYAARARCENGNAHIVFMHHVVLDTAPVLGKDIDHINGNGLDNRKCNLRLVTRQQNCFNSKAHADSTSKFKGVHWDKRTGKWRARICVAGKSKCLGRYDSEVEAAEVYNQAAAKLFGEFAYLNQI